MTHEERYGHERRVSPNTGKCLECGLKGQRKWKAANPEKERARKRAWAAAERAADPEKARARQRERRAANPEKARAQNRAWSAANAEKHRASARAWAAANPEKARANNRAWTAANAERVKANGRAWRAKNPERVRKAARARRLANPDKARVSEHSTRARRRGASGTHTAADVKAQAKRQRHRCYWCKGSVHKNEYHIDHVIPLKAGGSNGRENIVIACRACNLKKGARIWTLV